MGRERDDDDEKHTLKDVGDEQSAAAPGDSANEADSGVPPAQDAISSGAPDALLLAQNDDAARPERDDSESGELDQPSGATQLMRDVEQGSALFLPGNDIDSEVIAEQLVTQADPDDVVTAGGIQVNRWKIGDGRVFVLSDEGTDGTSFHIGYAPEQLDGFVLTRDLESGRVMAYRVDETGATLAFGVELSSGDYAEYAGNPLFDADRAMGATAFAGYVRAYAALVLQEDVDPLQLYELGTVINQLRDQLAATNQMFGFGGGMNGRITNAIEYALFPHQSLEQREAAADALLALIEPDQMAHAAARGNASARYAMSQETGEYPVPADTSLPPEDLSDTVTLRFDGSKLEWIEDGQVIESWPAVSGRDGMQGPEFQGVVDAGPIPSGTYFVRQDQYQSIEDISVWQRIAGLPPLDRGQWHGLSFAWGRHRVELFPAQGTETYGRTGMFLHGGAVPGSAGCVDLTSYLEAFIMKFHRLGQSVRLVVDYTGYEATSQ